MFVLAFASGCAAMNEPAPPAHPADSVRKVIDSLSDEVAQRLATDAYRNLPVVVRPTGVAGTGFEPIVAEFLRTRLVEQGIPVDAQCGSRCMEVTLQEFAAESPRVVGLSVGQVLSVAGGQIPVVGGLVRGLGEDEKEKERAARRATGFMVTFSAREGNRYTARANIVVISSVGDAKVAPERK
jgi:hypothetical protein